MDGKDNKIESNNLINFGGNLMDFSVPRIMAIANINEDSFYAGSRLSGEVEILKRVEKFLIEGADIIDVGAISTRPNADLLNLDAELDRLIPAIRRIRKEFPKAILSVDTFRSEAARQVIELGVDMINDVYGGRYDDDMFRVIGELQVPYVLMHSRGFSHDMLEKTGYDNVANDVVKELSEKVSQLIAVGVKDIIIDPGFGFAKTIEENFELLNDLESLQVFNSPILAGLSRKSMIYKSLNIDPDQALNGTIVLNTMAYMKGARLFRVHDVKPVREMIELINKMS